MYYNTKDLRQREYKSNKYTFTSKGKKAKTLKAKILHLLLF